MHLKKLMTGVMIFFLLGCFLCACGKTKDQTRKTTKDTNKQIIIGGDNYPPFNYTDENGNPAGIDVELAKEAFHRMGYKPVFVNIDWENKKIGLSIRALLPEEAPVAEEAAEEKKVEEEVPVHKEELGATIGEALDIPVANDEEVKEAVEEAADEAAEQVAEVTEEIEEVAEEAEKTEE